MKKKSLLLATFLLSGCLTPTGQQRPADIVSYGVQGGAGSSGIHTVLEGDTVYTVSQHYHLPLREIIAQNNLSAPYHLNLGYRLKLPAPNEYKVHKDDTLNNISKMFDVSLSETAKLNNLAEPYVIQKGQVLRLPSKQPKLEEEFAQNPALPPSFTSDELAGTQTSIPVKVGSVESEILAPPPGMTQANGITPSSLTPAAGANVTPYPPQPNAQVAKLETVSAVKPAAVQKIPARSSGKFMRPVDGKIISGYGPKEGGLHNDGINIKAAKGTAVRAAENGVIAYTGSELQGYGNLILVRHADRLMTAYAHLDKTLVKKGDVVSAGQSIGTVGSSGQVDSPQLHFEIRRGTQAINPDSYL